MFDIIRDAVIHRRLDTIRHDLLTAGRSLEHLIRHPETIETMDGKSVWTLLHGLEAALHVAEKTLRAVRRDTQAAPAALQRALRDMEAAITSVRHVLDEAILPYAEKHFPPSPVQTRWDIRPPEHLS